MDRHLLGIRAIGMSCEVEKLVVELWGAGDVGGLCILLEVNLIVACSLEKMKEEKKSKN